MKRRQLNLPAGHHDADSASEILGVSKRMLLKTLRDVGLLEIDKRNGLKGRHNLPRTHIKKLGWAYEYTCSFGSGPGKTIDHEYKIVIFTHEGFREVKKIMESPMNYEPPKLPTAKKVAPPPSECSGKFQSQKKSNINSISRSECLKDLEAMGITIHQKAS